MSADWKSAYASSWTASSEREIRISAQLSEALGVQLAAQGVGAGSSERVAGYAAVPGTADYRSPCGRLELEITGPLAPVVHVSAPLWIRPDKLAAAEGTLAAGTTTVIVHNNPARIGTGTTRYIVCSAAVLARWRAGAWPVITTRPRGVPETYVSIPASDEAVLTEPAGIRAMRKILGVTTAVQAVKAPVAVQASTPSRPRPTGAFSLPGLRYHSVPSHVWRARKMAEAAAA